MLAPALDLTGVIQVNTLEVGTIQINRQSVPSVKFVLDQNQSYPILASGQQAGEIYAYCAVARQKGIEGLDAKIVCTLLTDISGNLHVTVSDVAWYTSASLRGLAAEMILNVFDQHPMGSFKTCSEPFIVLKK